MSTFVYQVSKGCIYQKEKKREKLFCFIFLVEIYDRRKSNLYKKLGFHPRLQKLQNFGECERFYALLYFSYNHFK